MGNVMKAKNRLTDEQLAAMIENGFGFESLKFEDLATFEVASVAGKSMELIDEDALQELDFSFDSSCFRDRFEPLAMCGFLGEDDDDISPTDNENIDSQEEEEE